MWYPCALCHIVTQCRIYYKIKFSGCFFIFTIFWSTQPCIFGEKNLMGFALAILGECFWQYSQNIILKFATFIVI
jgi:hypothetical protein